MQLTLNAFPHAQVESVKRLSFCHYDIVDEFKLICEIGLLGVLIFRDDKTLFSL